jgi:hypothetical protein
MQFVMVTVFYLVHWFPHLLAPLIPERYIFISSSRA